MAERRLPYPSFTQALLKSKRFPDLEKHYQIPLTLPPPLILPPPIVPDFMRTIDERVPAGYKHEPAFFLPRDFDDESNYSIGVIDGQPYVGYSGDKVKKAGSPLASLWRMFLMGLRKCSGTIKLAHLRPGSTSDSERSTNSSVC